MFNFSDITPDSHTQHHQNHTTVDSVTYTANIKHSTHFVSLKKNYLLNSPTENLSESRDPPSHHHGAVPMHVTCHPRCATPIFSLSSPPSYLYLFHAIYACLTAMTGMGNRKYDGGGPREGGGGVVMLHANVMLTVV